MVLPTVGVLAFVRLSWLWWPLSFPDSLPIWACVKAPCDQLVPCAFDFVHGLVVRLGVADLLIRVRVFFHVRRRAVDCIFRRRLAVDCAFRAVLQAGQDVLCKSLIALPYHWQRVCP